MSSFSTSNSPGRASKILWVCLALCVSAGLRPAAADDSAEDIVDHVREKYEAIDDAEIAFTQQVTFERTNLRQSFSGELRLKKNNKYRLETGDKTVVTDGATVWSYSSLSGQVIIDNFREDERTISPEKILTGAPDEYLASVVGTTTIGRSDVVILKLVPQDEGSMITSLRLWVDESTWLIRRAEVSEFSGKSTEYDITSLKINVGLDDALFRYAVPEGVEVVDLR